MIQIFVFFIILKINFIKIILKGDNASKGIVRLAIDKFIGNSTVVISAVEIYYNCPTKFFDLLNERKKIDLTYESGEYKELTSIPLMSENVSATLRSIRQRAVVKDNRCNSRSSRGHCLIYLNIISPHGLKW